MRFLDANIFIYAFYKPKVQLSEKEHAMKEEAKRIISEVINGKEEVLTTVVHVSEIANILKNGMTKDKLAQAIRGLFMQENIKILDVTRETYFAAVEIGDELNLEPNDALAIDVMQQNGISEIYSFDQHFEGIEGIIKLPVL